MADLKAQVASSAGQLRAAWQVASTKPTGIALPPKCYEDWATIASLHASLAKTIPLFDVRQKACSVMQSLLSYDRTSREVQRLSLQSSGAATAAQNFTFDGVPMDFPLARHFAATGYVCSSWSLYDRLANVCGRLAAWKDIPDDPWQDPKLWGNLMGEGNKTLGGFLIQQPLANAYGWPTGVAYKIRNWLVHDGGDVGRGGFFRGAQITDGFILHPDAVYYLEDCCDYKCENGRINRCCLNAAEEPWPTHDLMLILEKYHGEMDTMLTSLVKWSVDSLVGQVSAFSDRDRQLLVTAAATAIPGNP
jgi:hypothetical protein